jgi:hypothetical protein
MQEPFNPLSALGAPPAPEQSVQPAAPVNAPSAPEPGVAPPSPAQSFENKRPSIWLNVLTGALNGLAASGGATSFGGGLGAGARGQMVAQQQQQAAQRQALTDESEIRFRDAQSAKMTADASLLNKQIAQMPEEMRLRVEQGQLKVADFLASVGITPTMIIPDDPAAAQAALIQFTRSHNGIPQVHTMHLGNQIAVYAAPTQEDSSSRAYVDKVRAIQGMPHVDDAAWKDPKMREAAIMDAHSLFFPANVTDANAETEYQRRKLLAENYARTFQGSEDEKQSTLAALRASAQMIRDVQAGNLHTKLTVERAKAAVRNSGTPAPIVPQGATGEAALAKLNPADAALVRKIANYDIDPRTLSTRGGHREKMMGLAALYDQSYDQTQYNAKNKARTDFTSGKNGQNIRAFNTAIGHLGQLYDAADALNNNDVQKLNQVANAIGVQTGSSAPVVFDAIRAAVAGELATTFKGAAGTDPEIKSIVDTLHSKQSPQQTRDVSKAYIGLLNSRLHVLDEQYKQAMGKPADFHILHPESEAVIQHMGVGNNGQKPQGKPVIVNGKTVGYTTDGKTMTPVAGGAQ